MLHMYLLTPTERELYQHVRRSLLNGIQPFLWVQFVLLLGTAFFFKHYFTVATFLIFAGALAFFSAILVLHAKYALDNNLWPELKLSAGLVHVSWIYLLVGFLFWTGVMFYLLNSGCKDVSMIMIFRGVCATFAVALLGIFQRVFSLIIVVTGIFSACLLYSDFGTNSSIYIIQLLSIHVFDYLLLRVQNQKLLGNLRIKSENINLVGALEQKNQELSNANLSQSHYLSAASHELRQPLHALALIIDEVQRKNANPVIDLPLKRMEQAIESLSKSFDAMLNLSRLDAGVIRPNIQAFAIQRLYDRLTIEFEATAQHKGLKFITVPSHVSVLSDEDILYSILSNLVSNAIRYTEQGGILIGTRRDGTHVMPMVYDTGVGIPSDQISQIFGEYKRLDYAHQRVTGGVGLGLSISERMATLLDAPFIVRSKLNQGSAFGVRLPRAADQKALTADIHATHSDYLSGKKVVILDDYKIAIEKLDELLNSWGMNVSVISSTDTLKKISEDGFIDLVISDYHLSLTQENGLDVLQYAQKIQAANPPHCVLITGDTTIDLFELTKNLGVHLQHKPMSPTRLRAFLNTLLGSNPPIHKRASSLPTYK